MLNRGSHLKLELLQILLRSWWNMHLDLFVVSFSSRIVTRMHSFHWSGDVMAICFECHSVELTPPTMVLLFPNCVWILNKTVSVTVFTFLQSQNDCCEKKKIKRNKAQTGLPHTVTLSRRNSCGCVRCCSTIIGHAHANKKKNQKEIHVWMSRFWRCPFVSSSRDSLELQWDACFFSVAAEASSSSEAAKRRRWLS